MSKTKPIAFLDSGVGLYSVLAETKKHLPLENYVVFADQGNNPYGEKSPRQIIEITQKATGFLVTSHNIKMLVLACNTATVFALDSLRKSFKIPIVGVVPAIKPAAKISKKSKIVVLSTPATAKSPYLSNLVDKFTPNSKVLKLGCPGLEEAIETMDKMKIMALLDKYSKVIKAFKADTVVLGCTHYPLIKNIIKKKLGDRVSVIDSGEAIASRIEKLLLSANNKSQTKTKDFYYTSGNPEAFSKISSQILNTKIEASFVRI